MKIAVNAQSYEAGYYTGIGCYTEQLYRNILKAKNDNSYTFFSKNPSQELRRLGRDNVVFKSTPGINDNKYARVGWENFVLPIKLRRSKPDLVHSVNYSLPYGLGFKMKNIVTVHDIIWAKFPDFFAKKVVYAARKRLQHSCHAADAIISVSQSTKRDILEHFDCREDKIVVIHEGVDHTRFRKMRIDSPVERAIRNKYELSDRFILWVGGFRKNKNIERLCRAFVRAKETISCPHKLVLCGHKDFEYRRIRDLFRKWDEFFVFTGAVEDSELPIIYNIADAFVLPSLYEGFGLPVLEAMACGTAVVTSNCSSLPEVASDAAILVNPQDEQEIADAIIKLIEDDPLRQSLEKRGLERARLFNWGDTANKTTELFEKVAG